MDDFGGVTFNTRKACLNHIITYVSYNLFERSKASPTFWCPITRKYGVAFQLHKNIYIYILYVAGPNKVDET